METISAADRKLFSDLGISVEQVEQQLSRFAEGFPTLEVMESATVGRGISSLSEEELHKYQQIWENYCADTSHSVLKFVPASGAATRMFKLVYDFRNSGSDAPRTADEERFFKECDKIGFYGDWCYGSRRLFGEDAAELGTAGRYQDMARALLDAEGVGYGSFPKGLVKFHEYADCDRTAVEEHLVESASYARMGNGKARIYFTAAPEHMAHFEKFLKAKVAEYSERLGVEISTEVGVQKSSTQTVAANEDGTIFRKENGEPLFRPSGHGALIENLNEQRADVVFVKNIDNVVPDHLRADTVRYKQVLAGLLVDLQQQVFAYLQKLDSGRYSMDDLREMLQFVQKKLCCKNPETKLLEDTELAIYLRRKLNRPLRVCGMVRNEGEAGGGPFFARNADGTVSLQIMESSQFDLSDPQAKKMLESGTHFNPVDLVCSFRNYKGEYFDLRKFVDERTGFISHKSWKGRPLLALERPGLWNGAMSDWNTVFVEVPRTTFTPVKTVMDLLSPEHQPAQHHCGAVDCPPAILPNEL